MPDWQTGRGLDSVVNETSTADCAMRFAKLLTAVNVALLVQKLAHSQFAPCALQQKNFFASNICEINHSRPETDHRKRSSTCAVNFSC